MTAIGWDGLRYASDVTAKKVEVFGMTFYDMRVNACKAVETQICEQFPSIIPDQGHFSWAPAKGRITERELTAFYLSFPHVQVFISE